MHVDLRLPAHRRYTAPATTADDPFDPEWARSIVSTARSGTSPTIERTRR